MNSTNFTSQEADQGPDNSNESILNDSAIKQVPGTRREPQGEVLEDEPYSNDIELGNRRNPQGELLEEPDSNQSDQVDRLNLNERWTVESLRKSQDGHRQTKTKRS